MKQRYIVLRTKPEPTAITADVLYTTYGGKISDCTNGGVTAKNERVLVLPLGVEPTPEQLNGHLPILKVVERSFGGTPYLHAEPYQAPGKGSIGSWMAGGNFIYSSDSRFRTWVSQYPISVHDRTETPEQYRALSI
jgi:hypothetical protein